MQEILVPYSHTFKVPCLSPGVRPSKSPPWQVEDRIEGQYLYQKHFFPIREAGGDDPKVQCVLGSVLLRPWVQ